MAIEDMKGTVSSGRPTMTGMVNRGAAKISPPDMSKIKMPTAKKPEPVAQATRPIEQPKEMSLLDKVQNLTDQDKTVLSAVLSPSVSNVLRKIAPDLSPLLDQAGPSEENVIIPVSVARNFAAKRYGGQNETEAISNFIADLQSSVPGMNNMMEQSTVPPGTQMAEQPEDMPLPETNQIDSGEFA